MNDVKVLFPGLFLLNKSKSNTTAQQTAVDTEGSNNTCSKLYPNIY